MLQKKPTWGVNSVNPLYSMIKRIDGFIEEIEGDKYLDISETQRNSKIISKYLEVWNGIKIVLRE